MRRFLPAALLLVLPFDVTVAQEAGPRAGAWAAEVSFSGLSTPTAGSLLRFRNDRSAWLLGLTATAGARNGTDFSGADDDETVIVVGARAGMRSLRSAGAATRPTFGFGIQGSYSEPGSTIKTWEAGAYAELGVARFFGSSFSLSGLADIQLRYRETRAEGGFTSLRSNDTIFEFDAVRIAATVYF